jgi:DNA helicase-2/ATP-dependent DNA helicase PcrA
MDHFSERYATLNPAQKLAVDTVEGPVMVIAGPGTGKTSILTLRIANILKKTDTRPEQILALTFTESGAQSMRSKLIALMGPDAYRVNIYTFHGFANAQIRRYPDVFPRIISSNHATDIEKTEIVENIIDGGDDRVTERYQFEILRPYGDPHYYVSSILSSIQHLKRENMSVADFEKYLSKKEKEFASIDDLYYESGAHKGKMKGKYTGELKHLEKNKELLFVYGEYEKALAEKKLYDFEDMLLELIKAMKENGDFLLTLQEEYQYLLADEHQDANNSQNAILELLASFHESPNLFVVGDEKQAIFRFQGASLQNFLYFKEKYADVTLINLEENYRSTQAILDASHSLIEHTSDGVDGAHLHGEESEAASPRRVERVRLTAKASYAPEPIDIVEFSSVNNERRWVAQEARRLIDSGVAAGEIAILFRQNREADALARAFDVEGIPYALYTDQDMLSDHEVRKLIKILEAINDPESDGKLGEIMFFDLWKLPIQNVHELFRRSRAERKPLLSVLSETKEFVTEFHDLFLSLTSQAKNEDLITFFGNFLAKTAYATHLVVGREGSVQRPLHHLASFEAFLNEVKRFAENNRSAGLSDFIDYLHRLEKYNIRIKTNTFSKDPDKVVLMTSHKSKGLEFEYVLVTGATDGIWGNTRDMKKFDLPFASSSSVDDDRRLFYVALTRAKKKAYVSYGLLGSDGKTLLPSQFVLEIDPAHTAKPDMARIEEELKKKSALDDFVIQQSSLFDKDYLRKIFLTEHFSVTALNNYLACPLKYFFNNLIRIPQLQSKHQMYGTAIHDTFRIISGRLTKGEPLVTKIELLELFEREVRSKPFSKIDFDESLKKGREALSGYYDVYHQIWDKNVLTEYAINGVEVLIPDTDHRIGLRGILDKVVLSDDNHHNPQEVRVVDYKTSKPKSRNEIEGNTKNATGDYKRQLVFYKYLLDAHKREGDLFYDMKVGEIDFIEPDEKGKYHREAFEISTEEVEELATCVQDTLKEIYQFDFFDKGCGEKDCEACVLKGLLQQ